VGKKMTLNFAFSAALKSGFGYPTSLAIEDALDMDLGELTS
jgi:hypothetical protein